jgi:hypothetical protein
MMMLLLMMLEMGGVLYDDWSVSLLSLLSDSKSDRRNSNSKGRAEVEVVTVNNESG